MDFVKWYFLIIAIGIVGSITIMFCARIRNCSFFNNNPTIDTEVFRLGWREYLTVQTHKDKTVSVISKSTRQPFCKIYSNSIEFKVEFMPIFNQRFKKIHERAVAQYGY